MNPILEKWLKEQAALKEQENLEKTVLEEQERQAGKEHHLRELGLIDKENPIYLGYDSGGYDNCEWDEGQQQYFVYPTIEVTDEEYELICKYAPKPNDVVAKEEKAECIEEINLNPENTLSAYATFAVILGVIIVVASIIGAVVAESFLVFVGGIIVLISYLFIWALLKVISEMSKTLKQINSKK